MNGIKLDQLEELFGKTAAAHHQAFIETDGADPEWPLWYAEHLQTELNELLGASFTKSEIVYLLVKLDKDDAVAGSEVPWSRSYAEYFVGRAS